MDKQIIDEERMFECVWCKYDFKESEAHFILSENPNECVCSVCMTEWADNLLCDFKRKEQECEELRQYHNKCCEEFEKEKKEWLEKYNQVSRDFYSGKYCNAEKCQQLDQLKEQLEAYKMEAEEGKEINAELKAERDSYIDKYFLESQKVLKLNKVLKEIKEIARVGAFYWKHYKEESKRYNEILQKISECEVE